MGHEYELGLQGERIAVDFLTGIGYTVIAQNYRIRGGEIDIIASSESIIVFVEVKTRSKLDIYPREYVNNQKQLRIIKAAQRYLAEYDIDAPCRFDVIEIFGEEQKTINHLIDAFSVS